MSFGFWKLKDGIFEGDIDGEWKIFVGFDQMDCNLQVRLYENKNKKSTDGLFKATIPIKFYIRDLILN